MSRRVGQIVALFSLFALVVVVIVYQLYDQQRLRGDVLTAGYQGTSGYLGTSVCGNGLLEGQEQCDDANLIMGDGCNQLCEIEVAVPVCGNGIVEPGEQCDFRDFTTAQRCSRNCLLVGAPVCGDALMEGNEACDDGNLDNGDGCSADCVIEQSLTPSPTTTSTPTSTSTSTSTSTTPTTSTPTAAQTTVPLDPNVPSFTRLENGLTVYEYFALYGERTVVDGLQVSQHVPQLTTEVHWVLDPTSTSSIALEDSNAARTSFVAPSQEGQALFVLEVKQQDQFVPVAKFLFRVVSPAVYTADANKDGRYDFSDLLDLLQKWQSYGNDATQILAIILSRYQE